MDTTTLTSDRLQSQCCNHWKSHGIHSTKTLKANLRSIFAEATTQQDALERIYRLVFPDWDQIQKIHGHPSAGEELWKFIARLFIEFDRKHHPNLMPGGAWMNTGFSVSREIDPWKVGFTGCTADLVPEPVLSP